jgi:hypothetical protein
MTRTALLSKVCACGRSIAGITGLNSVTGMGVRLLGLLRAVYVAACVTS